MHTSSLIMLTAMPLMAWRIYVRSRRLIGRQQLGKVRPWVQLVIFTIFVGLFSYVNIDHPLNLALLYGSALFGIALAWHGLKLTDFEANEEGLFYTPHTWIGVGLSVAFLLTVTYRVSMFMFTDTAPSLAQFGHTPAMVAVFGTFAGYYMTYAIGLLRWRASVSRADADANKSTGTDSMPFI